MTVLLAIRATLVILAFAHLLSSAEGLWVVLSRGVPDLLCLRWAEKGAEPLFGAKALTSLFSRPILIAAFGLRFGCATLVLAVMAVKAEPASAVLAALLVGLFVSSSYIYYFRVVGGDGADQMQGIVTAAMLLGFLGGTNTLLMLVALGFIAAQLILSYFTAGVAKLVSRTWRHGNPIAEVLGTKTYGLASLHALFRKHPALGRALAWSTIGFEVCMPLVLFIPMPWAIPLMACGICFHAGCAFAMGLNNFLISFAAAYPALIWVNHAISHAR